MAFTLDGFCVEVKSYYLKKLTNFDYRCCDEWKYSQYKLTLASKEVFSSVWITD